MKVKELIAKLQTFDQDLEVTVTDGYRCIFYGKQKDGTDFDIQAFHDFGNVDGAGGEGHVITVDIGIGGCEM